jgi:hypothetical protein
MTNRDKPISKPHPLDRMDRALLDAVSVGEPTLFLRLLDQFPAVARETLKYRYKVLAQRGLVRYEKGTLGGHQNVMITRLATE